MGMKPRRIEVEIQELVLEGFPAGDRRRILDAVQAEIERLLIRRGLPAEFTSSVQIDRIDGGSFPLQKNSKEDNIGLQVGKAVYGGLRK